MLTAIYVQVGPGLEENGKLSRQAAALRLLGELKPLLPGFGSLDLNAVSECLKLSPVLGARYVSTVKSKSEQWFGLVFR